MLRISCLNTFDEYLILSIDIKKFVYPVVEKFFCSSQTVTPFPKFFSFREQSQLYIQNKINFIIV